MVKTINFNAKDAFGKNFEIMDSFNNVQLVQAGLDAVYKAMDKVDDEYTAKGEKMMKEAEKKGEHLDRADLPQPNFLDYSKVICPVVVEETAKLLGLSREDKKKLGNLSYSYIQDFYAQACEQFTGIELPTIEQMKKNAERMQRAMAGQGELADDEEASDPK